MRPLALPAVALLAVALLAPTLGLGFYADDCLHQLALRDGEPTMLEPWSLYDFGERADWAPLDGRVFTFPWWTGEGWRVRFFRPLSSAYVSALHSVLGERAVGYHAAGLGLLALLVVSAHGLYRALGLSGRAALVGTLVLALSDALVVPVGWIANHNSLLVALLAVASLRLLAARELGAGRIALALAAAALAALAKEDGVASLVLAAIVLALRASAEPPRRRRFALGAAAALALAAAWATVLVAGGYGTASAFYATPWSDPARFAANLGVLAAGAVPSFAGPFPLDVATVAPAATPAFVAIGALLGVPIALWVARTVRGARGAGVLALWTALFVTVQAGGPPADRLLLVGTVGAAGLLGIFFDARWRAGGSRPARVATAVLLVAATAGSGASLAAQSVGLSALARHVRRTALATDVGSPDLGRRELYVLQAESQTQAFTLPATWALGSDDRELAFRMLQSGRRPVRLTRVDARTFELASLGAPFLAGPFEQVYLSATPDFAAGARWSTDAFDVEALAVEDGLPTRLRLRFRTAPDGDAHRFLRAERGVLTRIAPPAVGESIELPAPERVGPWAP